MLCGREWQAQSRVRPAALCCMSFLFSLPPLSCHSSLLYSKRPKIKYSLKRRRIAQNLLLRHPLLHLCPDFFFSFFLKVEHLPNLHYPITVSHIASTCCTLIGCELWVKGGCWGSTQERSTEMEKAHSALGTARCNSFHWQHFKEEEEGDNPPQH